MLQRIRDALATPPTGYVWLGTVYPGGLFGARPGLRLRYGGTGTFDIPRWRLMRFYSSPAIGRMRLDNTAFDPDAWRPRVPNAAFVRARADDRFWAARKLSAIDDDMIRAAVRAGQFDDAPAEAFLANAMIARRNAIGRKYLAAINPIVDPALVDGVLSFRNAAVDAGFARRHSDT